MKDQNFTAAILVDQSPNEVFNAINNVRGWWSEETLGDTDKQDAVFYYHFRDVHTCTIQITEFMPGKKVIWHVLNNYFDFATDQNEWTGTDIVFDITQKNDKTELHFTHVGLITAHECYDICSNAWGGYITSSLNDLITKGKGQPNPIEETPEVNTEA